MPSRYLPAQEVLVDVQKARVGEAAQRGRYLPAQPVAVEVQRYQIGEAAQPRRYLPWANHVQSPQSREKWHTWDSTVGPLFDI